MAIVLGIETSCDETGIGIVEDGRLLGDALASSMSEHARFGGVVPEIAARAHLPALVPCTKEALAKAGLQLRDIDAVAVTAGPGLASSLHVGIAAAKAYAVSLDVPLYAVHHLAGHAGVDVLEHGPFPSRYVALIVSGGHTSLLLVSDLARDPIVHLGDTVDDAAGEAFDKVARLLGLPYPGGPAIGAAATEGDGTAIAFPRALTGPRDPAYDFSFSGLKTAVARGSSAAGVTAGTCRSPMSPRRSRRRRSTYSPANRSAPAPSTTSTRCWSSVGSPPTRGCARWPPTAARPPGSRCGSRRRGSAPTTAR